MILFAWADPEGGRGSGKIFPEQSQNIVSLCNTGPDSLKNHKATKQAFNIRPASARQENAISMAFR